MLFDNDDLDALALMAWKEARGEGASGMLAVMHVAVNRAKAWKGGKPGSINEVIFQKGQFSSMTVESDPEFHLSPEIDDARMKLARLLATIVAGENEGDLTDGALYYANLRAPLDDWFKNSIVNHHEKHPCTLQLGKHWFYK